MLQAAVEVDIDLVDISQSDMNLFRPTTVRLQIEDLLKEFDRSEVAT